MLKLIQLKKDCAGPHSTYSSVLFKVSADDDKVASEGTGGRRAVLAAAAAKADADRKGGILGAGRGANLGEKLDRPARLLGRTSIGVRSRSILLQKSFRLGGSGRRSNVGHVPLVCNM